MQNDSQEETSPTSQDQFDPIAVEPQPVFNLPPVLLFLIGLCLFVHVTREYLFDKQWQDWVLLNFAYFPVRYMPEFFTIDFATMFSPIGYSFLHGGWAHLGMNMVWLTAFGSPVAYRIGVWRSLVFWCVTAIGAVLLHTVIYYGDSVPLIGASGAVSGFLGAAARFGFKANKQNPRQGLSGPLYSPADSLKQRGVLPFLLVWMAINFAFGSDVFGLNDGYSIAWEAHIGGLVTGFFAVAWLDTKRKR